MSFLFLLLAACDRTKISGNPADIVEDTALSDTGEETDTGNTTDTGASSEDTTVEEYAYQPPPMSICDASEEVEYGTLCAIQPSRLDSNARDRFSETGPADRNLGFGYHVIGFPIEGTTINGVYIHFTGSMGRGYHQDNEEYASRVLLNEAMQAGYIIIQIAYHNRYAVNSPEECIGNPSVDNCAGNTRYEKITGEDQSSVVDVPQADAIIPRLKTLFAYLDESDFALPVTPVVDDEISWSSFRIGGHSQGAGHALYITKYWDSAYTCLFGGPYDVPDEVPTVPLENIADWYLDQMESVDITNVRALLSADDSSYEQFLIAYNILGMEENTHWSSFSASTYQDHNGEEVSGHAAVVKDPAYRTLRYTTCFE